MDQEAYNKWCKHFDEKFEREHPRFVAWYKTTNDYRQGSPARVAWKSSYNRQEYLNAKSIGLA